MTNEIPEFSSDALEYLDEATMNVKIGGKQSGWKWTFAGPGHPQTVAFANRIAREQIDREKTGGDTDDAEETLQKRRQRNVNMIVGRLLGWNTIKLDGELLPFSPEAARKLLLDDKKGQIFIQALNFLGNEQTFMKRSAGA